MTRRNVFSTFIALFAITIIMLVGSASSASAQLRCCTYTVTVKGVPDACLPIRLIARWDCLATPLVTTYTATGSYVSPIPGLAPCPPASCRLLGVSLDNVTYVGPNQAMKFMIGNCCYLLQYLFDANGCISIVITPCF